MKKITLLLFMLTASFYSQAQSTLFEDSFESYTNFAITGIGGWTMTDVDGGTAYGINIGNPGVPAVFANSGVPKAFQVFNPALTTPATGTNWAARTGVQSLVCFNKSAPLPLVNDDWMISPQITLGTGNTVKFWAKSGDSGLYFAEKFSVYVSNTTTAVASFVKISAGDFVTLPAPGAVWAEYTYTIPASYDNAPVYVAIQCNY